MEAESELFVCRGCYRERERNPRSGPDEQEYCGSRRCQRVRKRRWDKARLRNDEEYRTHRREFKDQWRRAHASQDAAYRRHRRANQSVDRRRISPGPSPPDAVVAPRGSSVPVETIRAGRYLLRAVNAPGSATQTVEVSLIVDDSVSLSEQIFSASETDAFSARGSARGQEPQGSS